MMVLLSSACVRQTLAPMPERPKTPYLEKEKVAGPKVVPKEPLLAWLRQAGDAVIRFPVSVAPETSNVGLLGELTVQLNDSALGMSLRDRLVTSCAGAPRCTVWLEGRWRDGTIQVLHFARVTQPGEVADSVQREP
jgi:hypothetical protein